MKQIKNVWMYARRRGSDAQLDLQIAAMEKNIADAGYHAVGVSQDETDCWMLNRSGLKQALAAVKTGKADAVMVTRLTNISQCDARRERFIRKLQKYGGMLLVNNIPYTPDQ